MSRPTALTQVIHDTIVRALERGNTRKDAAAIAGISERTLRSWCERGNREDADEPFESLAADVSQAESRVRQAMIASILKAGSKGDWKAAAFYLERRDPEWRQNQQIKQELTGKDGGPLGLGVLVLPPEQLEDDGEDSEWETGSVEPESGPSD